MVPARSGALRGAAASLTGVAAQTLIALAKDDAVSAPVALAQAAIVLMPGPLATAIVGALHEWAMRLALACAVAAIVGAGAVAGAWRRPALAAFAFALGPLLSVALPQLSADLALTTLSAAVGAAVCVALALEGRAPARSPTRRRVLVAAAALVALGVLAAAGLRTARGAASSAARALPLGSARRAAVEDPSDPPLVASASAVPDITPDADFYVVDEAVVDPEVSLADWRLSVGGRARSAFALSYDELVSLPAVEQYQTLECISNEVGGTLVGNTLWVGVPVRTLLERADPLPDTRNVIFRSVEGYSSAIPLDAALAPTTLVAYAMGGVALPREHGFPARLLIPGRYGMKNVKWLGAIELTANEHLGFWERRGWDDEAVAQTMSRIDRPSGATALRAGEPTVIAGIAYGGDRGIARVEVSTDGGKTWREAALGRRYSRATWRRWATEWTPPSPGWHRLAVRAYDGSGTAQSATERPPLPSGATGIHSFQVEAR
jgi:DMSO/TMAO reductase YedYZ molybdopterin-dependent catalytic subunit